MTTLTTRLMTPAPRSSVTRRPRFGAGRVVAAVPAIIGSGLLLLVLFGWLGRWEGLVLLAWLTVGVATLSRAGETIAVRLGGRFRHPSPAERQVLWPAWTAALARAGLDTDDVDLYLHASPCANAYAVGRRSVAVTAGLGTEILARRHSEEQISAVLLHELAHLVTAATRFDLLTTWLAAPWRYAARLVVGLGLATVGRGQPRRLLAAVAASGVVIAVVQTARQADWVAALTLAAVAVCAVACPLADAAVSRRSEYAADAFVVQRGLGPQLARVLTALDPTTRPHPTSASRMLARHPSTDQRLDAIARTSDRVTAGSTRSRTGPGAGACAGR